MRTRVWALVVLASLAVVPVEAQETRGNINGTVQDSSGVVPGPRTIRRSRCSATARST